MHACEKGSLKEASNLWKIIRQLYFYEAAKNWFFSRLIKFLRINYTIWIFVGINYKFGIHKGF